MTDATAFTLRNARMSDVEGLSEIEHEAFSDPWPASAFTDVLRMPSARATVMADAANEPVAYCVLITAADQGEIANLAVARVAQRKGLAQQLLDDALAFARGTGVVSVFLEVRESNTPALALYLSRGFREIGRRRGYYQRPLEDALVLQWMGTT
ncbi:MAG: ribosomal protein S18-alanine N-acetyltransferase [Gemmatimonas sp.]